jgi:DNA-binding MarR family transcriptional regulator
VPVPGDRRASLVKLTAAGIEAFAHHANAHEAWINEMLGKLNADDVNGMHLRLDRLVETLEQGDF